MEMDYSTATDRELEAAAQTIAQERERRARISTARMSYEQAMQKAMEAARTLAELTGVYLGEVVAEALNAETRDYIALGGLSPAAVARQWRQPSTPEHGYETGAVVLFEGAAYESLADDNYFSPAADPAAWKKRS